jgi:hypothetical protein
VPRDAGAPESGALGPPETLSPAEVEARAAFAAAVVTAARARPGLVLLGLQCGRADAVGAFAHGVAVRDARTDELLWSFRDDRWDG